MQADLRDFSNDVNSDIDSWIAQAKQLQSDIERSKAIASDTIRHAEKTNVLHTRHEDVAEKEELLKTEVTYTNGLKNKLEQIRSVSLQLGLLQQSFRNARLLDALGQLKEVELGLKQLQTVRNTHALELLHERSGNARTNLEQEVRELWTKFIHFDPSRRELSIRREVRLKSSPNAASWDQLLDLVSELGQLKTCEQSLGQELIRNVLVPLLAPPASFGHASSIEVSETSLRVDRTNQEYAADMFLDGLSKTFLFLEQSLPASVGKDLSQFLVPFVVDKLVAYNLNTAMPTSIDSTDELRSLLDKVKSFAGQIRNNGWSDADELNTWTLQVPKSWLAKKRETSISSVRSILATSVRKTQRVERVVENATTPKKNDGHGLPNQEANEWNEDWTDQAEHDTTSKEVDATGHDDEDTSAWDAGDDVAGTPSSPDRAKVEPFAEKGVDDQDEAWGWNEHGSQKDPLSPKHARAISKEMPKLNGHPPFGQSPELEPPSRDIYRDTVTRVPHNLYQLIVDLCINAATLRTEAYKNSPIAPAALGLYTLPTLILAGYRALAPSHYQTLNGGNLLLFNDTIQLSESLASFVEEKSKSDAVLRQRLKLDADVMDLVRFGRRAYGNEMESQRTIVRDLIDGAQGFVNCTTAPFAAECENAVAMTRDHIERVHSQWRQIFNQHYLLQSTGSLLSTAVSKAIVDIEDISDIGEEESAQLQRFCEDLGQLRELFIVQEKGAKKDMASFYVNEWTKFQHLGDILGSNLAQLSNMWHEEGVRQEFDVDEMVDLIEALFADSDRRRKTIAGIRRN